MPFHPTKKSIDLSKKNNVVKNEKHYFNDRFMGVPIKCGSDYPSLSKILEALYVMVYEGSKAFPRPRGYHLILRFTEKMNSSTFSARLSTFYERKSGYTPLRLKVVEHDKDEDGLHHHFAIVLNDRLDCKSSLQRFMAKLKKGGFLANYEVIAPKNDPYGHHLRNLEEKDSYFKWISYLAKVYSKPETGQIWSSCKALSRALKEWKLAGKPDLRKQLLDRHQVDTGSSVDASGFIQLIDVSVVGLMPPAPPGLRYGVVCAYG